MNIKKLCIIAAIIAFFIILVFLCSGYGHLGHHCRGCAWSYEDMVRFKESEMVVFAHSKYHK